MVIPLLVCLFYRCAGFVLCCISIFTFILTFRYFFYRYRRRQQGLSVLSLSPILIGMLVSLTMISSTGIPFVLIQCFTCRPFKTHAVICKINAFICFAVGTFNMYMLTLLSIFRYVNIVHKPSSFSRLLEHNRGLIVIICALISLCWSIPPLFNVGNTYTSDPIGFYCSLDWDNSVFHSRLFIYSLLICNYFTLLVVLIYSNLRIYFILRHLYKSDRYFDSSLIPKILRLSKPNMNSSTYLVSTYELQVTSRKSISDRQIKRKLGRLQRLKIDRRYARITIIMVTQFVIAWTPYAILALMITHGRIELIRQYPVFFNISELLAKFSLILNPLILIYTNRIRQY